MPEVKVCRTCRAQKALEEFNLDPYTKSGRSTQCKACRRGRYKSKRKHPPQTPATLMQAVRWDPTTRTYVPADKPRLAEGPALRAFDLNEIESVGASPPEPKTVRVEETITVVEEHRLKKRVKDLEAEKAALVEQLSDGGEFAEVVAEVMAKQAEMPDARIAPRERTSGLREGTPLILASDWHVEEEVRPEQVAGRNRYNLEIAARRMERFFEAAMWAWKTQRQIFKIRDCIPWFGGDLITNFLHEENNQSNLLSPTEAIMFAETNIIKGIDYWLTDPEMEQFLIPLNDGNHGRTTKKMQASTRTEMSLEVLMYAHLVQHYRNEPRIRFVMPTSQFTFLDDVYGRTIRFLHGDVFKYGGGIGGITVPLFRALGRWEKTKHADLTCMGHWHQRYCLPDVMINGSLIGYNAYAMAGGFPFEAPVQSMRMLDPLRWCSTDIPLWVSERNDDDANKAFE